MKHSVCTAALLAALLATPATADMAAGVRALEARDFETAIGHFEDNLKTPDTAFDAHWRLGEALVKAGQSKDALEYLERALELKADHADAHYWYGAANGEVARTASMFSALGYAKACRNAFTRAVELDPAHLPARQGLISFHLEAPGMAGGDKEEALKLAEELVTIDRAKGLDQLATVYQALERTDDALKTYDTAIAEFPGQPGPYLRRGLLLRELERYDAAVADFRTLANFPETTDEGNGEGAEEDAEEQAMLSALGRYFLGSVASMSGSHLADGKAALQAYLEAGVFDADWREGFALYYLARIHVHEGNKAAAEQAVALIKTDGAPKELRKRVKRLKKDIRKI